MDAADLTKALQVFGLENLDDLDLGKLKILYRELAKQKHPDTPGGSNESFVQLQEAYAILQQEVAQMSANSRKLKVLSTLPREEIIKYAEELAQSLTVLQTSSQKTLAQTKEKVENLMSQFESDRQRVQREMEEQVSFLETEWKQNRLQRLLSNILFFLPGKYSEKDFWQNYNQQIQKYAQMHSDLELKFYRQILDVYGDGLNTISQLLTVEVEPEISEMD